MTSTLRDIVDRKFLLKELIVSELRQRDAGTLLGPIWWLIDPIVLMFMYWMLVLILGRGGGRPAFPVFILCGLICAKYITGTMANTAGILWRRNSLIQAYNFPTIYLPYATVVSNLVFFAITLPLLGVVGVVFFGRSIGIEVSQLLLLVVPMTALTAGLSLMAAVFGAMIRDLANVIAYGARIMTYASPVIYGPERIQRMIEGWADGAWYGTLAYQLYMSNPLAISIVIVRGSVYEPAWVAWPSWALLFVEAAIVYAIGHWMYRRYERRVVKFV